LGSPPPRTSYVPVIPGHDVQRLFQRLSIAYTGALHDCRFHSPTCPRKLVALTPRAYKNRYMTMPHQHELRGVYLASTVPFDQRGSGRPLACREVRLPRLTMPDELGARIRTAVQAFREVTG
jgi:hypothetical protein